MSSVEKLTAACSPAEAARPLRVATWNINSIRARADRALAVLERHDLDVLLLQEIKCKPEQFPVDPFTDAGYEVASHGLNQWNGVAIISRVGIDEVATQFPNQPGFAKNHDGLLPPPLEARAIGAVCGGVEMWSVYVPNGRAIGDPHYQYKLDFLEKLADYCGSRVGSPFLIGGDWNVIPTDDDVWDRSALDSELYLSDPERAAYEKMADAGLVELSGPHTTNYTFWDYQKGRFPKNEGMRIDYIWASPSCASRAVTAFIDRDERKGTGASDHVPVVVEFA